MLKIYNTLTRQTEYFKSIEDKLAGLYTCGPTVYQRAHIGNMRAFLFSDVLRRTLEFDGYKINQVINITDVGHLISDADTGVDKLEAAAREKNLSAWDIAEKYTKFFVEDLAKLNIELPAVMPRATDHISEQIDLIKKLEKKGYTYQITDGIYFDTSKFKKYGQMAHLNLAGQRIGSRVEDVTEKKNPYDFALWKFSPQNEKRQMEWPSPWGIGFPGWHIECSAMSTKYLGQPFDIHTGGIDHIPIHHTNEIAQSEAAYGKPLANYFAHSEFILWGQDKMSKSQGNYTTVTDLEKKGYDPLAFRYLVLTAHYRSKLNFSYDGLTAASRALSNLKEIISSMSEPTDINTEYLARFKDRIDDDLDTPGALALTWNLLKSDVPSEIKSATLFKFDEVLGLKLREARVEISDEVQQLIEEREKVREKGEYSKADEIRSQIEKAGYFLQDAADGSKWFKK